MGAADHTLCELPARGCGAGAALGGDVLVGVEVRALCGRRDAAHGEERDQLLAAGGQGLAVDDPPGGGGRHRGAARPVEAA